VYPASAAVLTQKNSIKMALRWVFREIEERLHQKMVLELNPDFNVLPV